MQKGQIIKAIAGVYFVESENTIYQCKARGKFRKDQFKPLVGDFCEFSIENQTEGYIFKIDKRKNQLVRPAISNIDQALLVFSIKEPDMNYILLDRFLALIEYHQIKPIICVSKIDFISCIMIAFHHFFRIFKQIYFRNTDNRFNLMIFN